MIAAVAAPGRLIAHRVATAAMDTAVSVEVVSDRDPAAVRAAMGRALDWFGAVERACSRFDPASDVRRLLDRVGEPVPVDPILFEAARFSLALAERTGGAFDPTVGARLEGLGFDRHWTSGRRTPSGVDPATAVSYRDVRLDPDHRTIALRCPLVLDLGAVAKGLAIDLAARELLPFGNVCVEAGGDVFAAGVNARGEAWRIGIRDPRDPAALLATVPVTGGAVCTSGGYERRTADGAAHHILDARTGQSSGGLVSVTVVAPTAMAADGLATAAFVLGPTDGRRLLDREGVAGLAQTAGGKLTANRNWKRVTR